MSDSVNLVGFIILGGLTAGGAVAMLASKNVVHAGFWLLEVSAAAAGLYFLLAAEYVALMQLLIYAGAVAVLIIFTVMITMRRREDSVRPLDWSWSAALMAGAFFGLILLALFGSELPAPELPEAMPDLVAFGKLLFSVEGWALPFEIASLVLTSALVAAVWWTREGGDE